MALKFDMSNPQWQQQYGNQLYGGGAPNYAEMGEAIGMGAGLLGQAMHRKFAPAGKAYEKYYYSGDRPEGELPKSYEAWKATDWQDQKAANKLKRLEERAERFGPKYESSPLLQMFFDKEAGESKKVGGNIISDDLTGVEETGDTGGGSDDPTTLDYREDPNYEEAPLVEEQKQPDRYKLTPLKGIRQALFGGTEEGVDYTGLVPGVLGAGAKAFTGTTEKAGKALDNLIQSQTKTAGYGGGVLADVMKQGKLGMENVRQENIEKKEKIKEFFGSDQMRKIFRPKQYKAEIEASSGASGYDKYASSFSKDIGNSLANAINTYPGLKSKLTKEDYEKLSYLSEMDKGGLGRGGSVGQRAQEFINEILGREQLLSKEVIELNKEQVGGRRFRNVTTGEENYERYE